MKRRPSRLQVLTSVIIAVAGVGFLASYYTDWLWFQSLDLQPVFWRTVRARFVAALLFGIPAALLVGINLWIAERFSQRLWQTGASPWKEGEISIETLRHLRTGYRVVGAAIVLILGAIGSMKWPLLLRYTHSQPFGIVDPIFSRDVGFYVFSLPLYRFWASFLLGGLILTGLLLFLRYLASGGIRFQERMEMSPWPRAHLSALGGVFLLVIAWIYRLKIYGLLYSEGSVAFGASFVDVNVQVWVYWLLVLLFLGAAGLFFANVRKRGARLPLMGGALLLGGMVVLGWIPAALVQKLFVQPSELAREAPYIRYNIDATRRAYGLDRIEEQPFAGAEDLSWKDIEANPLTIRNVRIWDERPLIQTYQQVQEIRPYYGFSGVDVDRYTVDGVYRQVMLSAREMVTERLPSQARNWVNERLQYTHGYGVAMSPVDQVTPQGLPSLMVKDIPPIWEPGLEIDRPEIYYGEQTHDYVVVKTTTQEFDYPKGEENKFVTYQGEGGVILGGLFNRLAFAVRFKDLNLILSNYITRESRIMFRRQVEDRIRAIAPFLQYDSDPYLVVSEGRLYWVLDAYTTTDMYPYSAREGRGRINYIRNSVKAVVDAYNGTVHFYRMDPRDPIIAVYADIFPGLFRPLEEMPEDLRSHLRYPKDLFKFQAMLYRSYHMQDVQLFYNQEDLWEIPNEIYSGQAQMIEPYYIIVKLPREEREEFLLMVPFTPARKDNMIGWLAARCDGTNYGDLLVYRLPKDRLIFGPMQLEARIDQQPEISSQLTLWGQRGSEVIRGNLLVIPIEHSFLCVEPIYLQARQQPEEPEFQGMEAESPLEQLRRPPVRSVRNTAIPELKQVIVALGGQVIMRGSFEEALSALFARDALAPEILGENGTGPVSISFSGSSSLTAAEMAKAVEDHFRRARASLQRWDWAEAGEEMEALETTIAALREKLRGEQ